MSEIAREFDMGKNPVSKTNLLKTLQTVITAMLGEQYKATSHDVNFLMSVYSKKNRKALTVTCSNHRYFRNYLAEVCHRIVTGKSYELACWQFCRMGNRPAVFPMPKAANPQKEFFICPMMFSKNG